MPGAIINLAPVDYLILIVYFVFVLGIGWALRRYMKTSTDFFLSGRAIPAWICGLAFLSANLGAQEVIGMAASGAKYGIMTSHFYWVGAIPAMVFVGHLHDAVLLRLQGPLGAGVPQAPFRREDTGVQCGVIRGDDGFLVGHLHARPGAAAGTDPGLQLPHVHRGFRDHRAGLHLAGRSDLGDLQRGAAVLHDRVRVPAAGVARPAECRRLGCTGREAQHGGHQPDESGRQGVCRGAWTQSWTHMASADANPMGVEWFGMAMGLGFVLSFGYWCTDFLVVQRAMAADSMSAARRTPLIAAVPKMLFPALVILPGMIAIALHQERRHFLPVDEKTGDNDYNMAIPVMLAKYCPAGLAGYRHHGADGLVHVGHGRQRHGVQHGVDLRSIPELHSARATRPALPADGPRHHGGRHPDQRRLRVRGA